MVHANSYAPSKWKFTLGYNRRIMLELSSGGEGDQDLPAKSIERCLLIGGNHDDDDEELDFEVNVLQRT